MALLTNTIYNLSNLARRVRLSAKDPVNLFCLLAYASTIVFIAFQFFANLWPEESYKTILTGLFSMIGVCLLFVTFRAANRTAMAAEYVSMGEMLPFFEIGELKVVGPGKYTVSIDMICKNVGGGMVYQNFFESRWMGHDVAPHNTSLATSPEPYGSIVLTAIQPNGEFSPRQRAILNFRNLSIKYSPAVQELKVPEGSFSTALCSWKFSDIYGNNHSIETITKFYFNKRKMINGWVGLPPNNVARYTEVLDELTPIFHATEIVKRNRIAPLGMAVIE